MDASPEFPRRSRVPVFNVPGVVTLSIGLLMAIQGLREFLLPDPWDIRVVLQLALVPARWTVWSDPARAAAVIQAAAGAGDSDMALAREAFARFIASEHALEPWTFATYALLHGSWLHVIFNSVWLAAFGSPVARRCGAWRYGVIGLVGTVAGGILHVAIDPLSAAPLIGASAGVSALMAAAARFVFQPPVSGYGGQDSGGQSFGGQAFGTQSWQLPPHRPAETIPELMRNRTAVAFLAIWLATNLLFGLASVPLVAESATIAWDAHLGGFIAGFLLFPLLDPRRPIAR